MKRILIVDDSPKWVQYHKTAILMKFQDKVYIECANSAKEGMDKLMASLDKPFDVILTDMQMEPDFLPLYAGEWFIKQIRLFKEYRNTKIVTISAASNLSAIAGKYNVDYIPKYSCKEENAYDKIGEI